MRKCSLVLMVVLLVSSCGANPETVALSPVCEEVLLGVRGVVVYKDYGSSKKDLSHQDLEGANFRGIDISGSDLSHTNLSGADLRGTIMHGTDLSHADLSNANLFGADLREATLLEVNLNQTNLHDADLRGATITDVVFMEADVRNADFSCSTFDRVRFNYSQTGGANFSDVLGDYTVVTTTVAPTTSTVAPTTSVVTTTTAVDMSRCRRAMKEVKRVLYTSDNDVFDSAFRVTLRVCGNRRTWLSVAKAEGGSIDGMLTAACMLNKNTAVCKN